jgi:hypothetical protein
MLRQAQPGIYFDGSTISTSHFMHLWRIKAQVCCSPFLNTKDTVNGAEITLTSTVPQTDKHLVEPGQFECAYFFGGFP